MGDDRVILEVASKVQIHIERQQVARMDKKTGVSEDDNVDKKEVKKK